MGFTELSSAAGLKTLDSYLVSKSYIEGSSASQADVAVFEAVGSVPDAKYVNAARWYKHIATFKDEFASLPGTKKEASAYGPETVAEDKEDDEDVDLFGSDDEDDDEAAEELKKQRLAEYQAKKAAKGAKPAAKSIVTLDVKAWDDETDMDELLAGVKAIDMDGLVWGGHQFLDVGFGMKKLQINCVIEDDKVSVDALQESIQEDEDHVQSTDVAAMQKL